MFYIIEQTKNIKYFERKNYASDRNKITDFKSSRIIMYPVALLSTGRKKACQLVIFREIIQPNLPKFAYNLIRLRGRRVQI